MAKFISSTNMATILDTLKGEFRKKVDVKEGLQLSQESYTTVEKTKLAGVAEGANNYVHPNALVGKAGTYTSVTVDAAGHVTAAQKLTTLDEYGVTQVEAAKVTGVLSADNIPDIDATKVTGMLSIDNIPHAALERCVPVSDQSARFALTTDDVQLGDTVKQNDTGIMYLVIDTAKLGEEAGYEPYKAGSAASVPWAGVEGKPDAMKNPSALTIQVDGAEKAVYDGASPMTVNITAADINIEEVSSEEIESMLNGTYTEGEQA